MKVCAIVNKCVQVGPEDWKMKPTTRIFDTSRPISDVLEWVEAMGIKNPTCNDFVLADHTGDSDTKIP